MTKTVHFEFNLLFFPRLLHLFFPSSSLINTNLRIMSKRLRKELSSLMKSGSYDGVSAFPDCDNILRWTATIDGTILD